MAKSVDIALQLAAERKAKEAARLRIIEENKKYREIIGTKLTCYVNELLDSYVQLGFERKDLSLLKKGQTVLTLAVKMHSWEFQASDESVVQTLSGYVVFYRSLSYDQVDWTRDCETLDREVAKILEVYL